MQLFLIVYMCRCTVPALEMVVYIKCLVVENGTKIKVNGIKGDRSTTDFTVFKLIINGISS